MSDPHHTAAVPRSVLVAAAALLVLSLVSVGAGRISGVGTLKMPAVDPVQTRDLRFADRDDGAVVVTGDRTHPNGRGQILAVLAPGTNGFIRGVMRGLARERMLNGIGAEAPFRLNRGSTGRLTLEDPSTGRLIDLEAFGPTNAAAFARLLDAE